MGLINDALDMLTDDLASANLVPVIDPRNARPNTVVVGPPVVEQLNNDNYRCVFPVTVVCPPPGNLDAVRYLYDIADVVLQLSPVTATATPTTYAVGGQELPAYEIQLPYTVKR